VITEIVENLKSQYLSRSTQELLAIWKKKGNSDDLWTSGPDENITEEGLEAIRQILVERQIDIRSQPKLVDLQPELADSEAYPQVVPGTFLVEICLSGEEKKVYNSYDLLRKDILKGKLRKDYKARLINPKSSPPDKNKTNHPPPPQWSTLEGISNVDFSLQSLYTPVWAHTMKGLGWGVSIGITLKAIDTAVYFFSVDPVTGIFWLLVLGSIFLTKGIWAPVAVAFMAVRIGIRGNLFITFFAVALVGSLFGGPAGMVVGTLIGAARERRMLKAPDAVEEGSRPYLNGLVFPALFLVLAIPFYLFWLVPHMLAAL
jgi:hypothetical protein